MYVGKKPGFYYEDPKVEGEFERVMSVLGEEKNQDILDKGAAVIVDLGKSIFADDAEMLKKHVSFKGYVVDVRVANKFRPPIQLYVSKPRGFMIGS